MSQALPGQVEAIGHNADNAVHQAALEVVVPAEQLSYLVGVNEDDPGWYGCPGARPFAST